MTPISFYSVGISRQCDTLSQRLPSVYNSCLGHLPFKKDRSGKYRTSLAVFFGKKGRKDKITAEKRYTSLFVQMLSGNSKILFFLRCEGKSRSVFSFSMVRDGLTNMNRLYISVQKPGFPLSLCLKKNKQHILQFQNRPLKVAG